MYEECNTVNEVIEEIFRSCLMIKYSKVDSESELFGFYLSLKSLPKAQIQRLEQLKRLFYNASTKASNTMLGLTNESDYYNYVSEGWMYIYECLSNVFTGAINDKLEDDIKCYSLDDVKRILNNEELCSKLCKYTITYVGLRFKTLSKSKSNPDYFISNGKYVPIKYNYCDDENAEIKYSDLFQEEYTKETGDLSSYILETYWDSLTRKQQLFCKCLLEFSVDSHGNICDLENRVLYIKQEVNGYKNAIRKRLTKLIEQDTHIDMVNNRYVWRD